MHQVIKLKNIPPKEQEACKNEVELLSRMCHPNIVGYTNSFLYKNCLCIIMEYCDAGDLGDRVNEAKVRVDHPSREAGDPPDRISKLGTQFRETHQAA